MQTTERGKLLSAIDNLDDSDFERVAMAVFHYQARHNPVYNQYLRWLNRSLSGISSWMDIPFMPVSAYKYHLVQTGQWTPERFFESSGTTGQTPARHAVRDVSLYLHHVRLGFEAVYGDPSDWCIMALLPGYLERGNASLVCMVEALIRASKHPDSGFFLNDLSALSAALARRTLGGTPVMLIGVSFALLHFGTLFPMDLSDVTIVETGGMKGSGKELTRASLHAALQSMFNAPAIHSEYGMTELFSQAYSQGDALFKPTRTMRVVARDAYDPFAIQPPGRSGVLQVADLANLDTCAFLGTEDLGRVYTDGRFEMLGRLDVAETRGCNLMVEGLQS
jgi:hypothetical protein